MSDKVETRKAWKKRDPRDGYAVIVEEAVKVHALHVGVYDQGKLANFFDRQGIDASVAIKEFPADQKESSGAARRLDLLLQAVARYFNTGGDWAELERAVTRAKLVMKGGAAFPGWHYHDGFFEDEESPPRMVHVFRSDDLQDAIVWTEGSDIDFMPIGDLYDEPADNPHDTRQTAGALPPGQDPGAS